MPLRLFLVGLLLLSALGLGLIGYQASLPQRTVTVAAAVEAPPPPLTIDLLAAAQNLPAGTLLKEADLARRTVRSADAPPDALSDTADVRSGLRGALLRRYVEAGGLLTGDVVLHPRDRGFLAAVLTPGLLAYSVGVDAITGNGGLIWPGDRVDVILTQEIDVRDGPPARRFVGETVLRSVRVVAVDQSITQGAVAGGENAGRVARTVTLELTPREAEQAAVADRLGKISLAIRAAEETATRTDPSVPVYAREVSSALADAPTRVRVIDGKDVRDMTFP